MTVLVIGANGAIGTACVAELKSHGEVIATDLKEPSFAGVKCDVLDVTDAKHVLDVIAGYDEINQLSGLVYAAGLNTTGPVDDIDWQVYERVMAVNLRGAFHVGAAITARLRKFPRKFSSVFIASTAGLLGEAGGTVYCASKFGLIGFTQSVAGELAPFGGRANAVCPGNVDSPMLAELATKIGARVGMSGEATLAEWKRASAFKRLIEPAEVARTCAWLLSDNSSGISGQSIVVDGPRA